MTERPSAEEAANALREIDQRKEQALGSQRGARWADIVFGVVIFLYLASNDFLPSATAWSNWAMAGLLVSYLVAKRTRRGGVLLGLGAQPVRRAVPPKFATAALLVFAVLCAASILATMFHLKVFVPYLSTGLGAVLGLTLILFGRKLNSFLPALAARSRHGGSADGRA
ncbi:hypothetical protein [Amycolatopsis sp. NPDC059021]|uniref:hypothetical protein n=1 Tax=Amycolatopsis sp. NPDC059021 TaxID=3346704 RepID=UPI0036719412